LCKNFATGSAIGFSDCEFVFEQDTVPSIKGIYFCSKIACVQFASELFLKIGKYFKL